MSDSRVILFTIAFTLSVMGVVGVLALVGVLESSEAARRRMAYVLRPIRAAAAILWHHRLALVGVAVGGIPYVLPHVPGRYAAAASILGLGVSWIAKGLKPPTLAESADELRGAFACAEKLERRTYHPAGMVPPNLVAPVPPPPPPPKKLPPPCRCTLDVTDDQVRRIVDWMDRVSERSEQRAREFVETFTKPTKHRKRK